jgi:HupE / UreJ protein
MKTKLAAGFAVLLLLGVPGFAHRLDEYLQAAMISLEKDRVQVSIRLIPGIAVSSRVLASIDRNADGIISEAERAAYAERVLGDLLLRVDGHHLTPRLISVDFPKIADIREGIGEIQIEFGVELSRGSGSNRRLIFENHHQSQLAAYLVNCLVPGDRNIRVVTQNRNRTQSFYQLDYVQAEGHPGLPAFSTRWAGARGLFGSSVGFVSIFRLGMRHIAEGADHLLFLLTLLLPAPLMVSGSRWAGFAGVRYSLSQILKVVTAFTVGHSLTLALAALGVVRVPSRPIEVLIAVSILFSAVHALRPLFPGREAAIASFFGLIHGLAFAATLEQLGLSRWQRVTGILGFNLGIETMQLIVVAATMPSLVLLSRTSTYTVFRTGGAIFAAVASAGWILERLLQFHNAANILVESVAHHAVWIAVGLVPGSLICAWFSNVLSDYRHYEKIPRIM